MFTRNSGSAQGDNDSPCMRCYGTGIVLIPFYPGFFYPKEAGVACSCDKGNALWSRILEIMNRPQEEARQERVDGTEEQEEPQQKRQTRIGKRYPETLDMLHVLQIWRPKK